MNRCMVFVILSLFLCASVAHAQTSKSAYPDTELRPQPAALTVADDPAKKVEVFSGKISKVKGQYILFDPATEKSFLLDDQKTAAKYDRKSVAISGILDAATNTIHIQRVYRG